MLGICEVPVTWGRGWIRQLIWVQSQWWIQKWEAGYTPPENIFLWALVDLSVHVAATVTTNIHCGWVQGMQSMAKCEMTHHCHDLLHCLLGHLAFWGHHEELSHVSDSRGLSYRVMFFACRLDWPWMLKVESKLDLGVWKCLTQISRAWENLSFPIGQTLGMVGLPFRMEPIR